MKRKTLFKLLPILSLILALGAMLIGLPGAVGAQEPLGTGFTYQGRLFDDGNPTGGTFDFEFKLFDKSTTGSQLGSTITKDNVIVTDGIFTVKLDFGSSVFTGDARWLEVGVRPGNSSGAYTTLTPRQALTAVPYAIYALSAGTGANGDSWSLTGNAGTNPATHFLGTTDNQPLVIKTNGTEAMRIDTDGNVGIGTEEPGVGFLPGASVVHVAGQTSAYVLEAEDNGQERRFDISLSPEGKLSVKDSMVSGPAATRFVIDADGNVGIGTRSPGAKLHVEQGGIYVKGSGPGFTGLAIDNHQGRSYLVLSGRTSDPPEDNYHPAEIQLIDQELNRTWGFLHEFGNNFSIFNHSASTGYNHPLRIEFGAPNNTVFVNSVGNVGIGTTEPGAKLDVAGNVVVGGIGTDNMLIFNDDGTGDPDLARISTETADTALDIVGPGGCPGGDCSNRQVNIHNRLAVYGDLTTTGQVTGRGVVGEATATSGAAYGVVGESKSPDGAGVVAGGIDYGADLILAGNADTMTGDDGRIYSDPAYSSSDIWLITNDGVGIKLDHNRDGEESDFDIYDNDDNLIFRVNNSGTTSIRGNVILRSGSTGATIMELGEGLDYAEGFDVSDKTDVVPGNVLIIDPEHPGELTISDQPYDSKVAGIVAGAQGMSSAVRLGAGQFDYDVALAGRVYCNVDATEAGVEPGDLLTTSATPGYAMKATDYARAQGAILGKAMERLEKGKKGQILVLVTLQ